MKSEFSVESSPVVILSPHKGMILQLMHNYAIFNEHTGQLFLWKSMFLNSASSKLKHSCEISSIAQTIIKLTVTIIFLRSTKK
jgi:hypothetical protein